MSPKPDWIPEDATRAEEELLRKKVSVGPPKDLKIRVPDSPDIAPEPETAGERPLALLRPDELPVVGRHFVVWGSVLLDDIRERPVRKASRSTEDEYARQMVAEAHKLVDMGLKNPRVRTDPKTRKALMDSEDGGEVWDRMDRANAYARWRYQGYVCGEVHSL